MTEDEVTVMKQIWSLMIHEGRPTDPNADWSIYCGDFNDYWQLTSTGWDGLKKQKDAFIEQIKEVGVNIYRCDVPEYNCYGHFCDSNSPCDQVHVWTGNMLLNDGTKIFVSAKDIDLRPLVNRLTSKQDQVDLVKLYFG